MSGCPQKGQLDQVSVTPSPPLARYEATRRLPDHGHRPEAEVQAGSDDPVLPEAATLAEGFVSGASARATRREWIGLAVIALPCLVYSMDLTVMNLALPTIGIALHATGGQLLWMVDIYGFMVAGSLITMGTIGDRIGRRRLLLIGAAAFGIISILAALAESAGALILLRALLGVTGATLAPSTLSLIRNMFHDEGERTTAIGIWMASFSAGAVIGPLLGGILITHFFWGSVFLVSVPAILLVLVLTPLATA